MTTGPGTTGMLGVAAALLASASVLAGPGPDDDELVVNGEIRMVTETGPPAHVEGFDRIWSGWRFRTDETQAMQMDDFDNPAMLFVETAAEVWSMADGGAGKSCASCHDDVSTMAGVKAVYPKWNPAAGEVRSIEMQVNDCRTTRMGAGAWKYEGEEMTSMVALLASVSRGMPVNVAIDGPARATWERGREMYYTRFGQLELSCANCHEDNYGNMIRADHLSQGHTNGFPAYRLENTRLVAVHTRFNGCVRDTRAHSFAPGSPEFLALELYVASRGNGLSVEGPSVRN